jgi:hypothetical protein
MRTGYEQVRSVVLALTGDWEAARQIDLVLPETGVCSSNRGGSDDDEALACCQPAVSNTVVSNCCGPAAAEAGNTTCCTPAARSVPVSLSFANVRAAADGQTLELLPVVPVKTSSGCCRG